MKSQGKYVSEDVPEQPTQSVVTGHIIPKPRDTIEKCLVGQRQDLGTAVSGYILECLQFHMGLKAW